MTTLPVRTPYGRHVESRPAPAQPPSLDSGGPLALYTGPTYYGLPALKRSHYGPLVSGYLFVGGLAGSAQLLATVADLAGPLRHRSLVRAGRYVALGGAALSPVLLIADLETPRRFYNMLRIFRKTSPMSIGSWTLTAFGTLSGLTAAAQLLVDATGSRLARRLARAFGLPAAAVGAVMSVYTGSLLAATSTPLWAATPRLLPALFGSSALSTAVAALSLTLEVTGAPRSTHRALAKVGAATSGAELALATAAETAWRTEGVDAPLRHPGRSAALYVGVLAVGVAVPLAVHAAEVVTGRRSRFGSLLAAAATLAGGFLLREIIVAAGNESADRPQDYFHFTRHGAEGGDT
jgi:protein NrfD